MVALYAELDEKADTLRRADETEVALPLQHEPRVPHAAELDPGAVAAPPGATRTATLGAEQEKQVTFIRKAAEDLSELVNDLLDLAKVEAGKVVDPARRLRRAPTSSRPCAACCGRCSLNDPVPLVFEEPAGLPMLHTDEGKVSQILRNFLSNALKFTERGEIRVRARRPGPATRLIFSVADTGIGIAPEDQRRIFEEFGQVENPLQRRVKGTGLGLPLVRRLATLLGGSVSLESTPGLGSTFTTVLPTRFAVESDVAAAAADAPPAAPDQLEPGRVPVLVVEDSAQDLLLYDHYLRGSRYQPVVARTLSDARRLMDQIRPVAMILDIRLAGEDTWAFIGEIRRRDESRDLPLVVVSSIDDQAKGLALGADAYAIKPVHPAWLLGTLNRLLDRGQDRRVLVIDDDEIARYLVRNQLAGAPFVVTEAGDPIQGLREARAERPDVIVLDLVMPEMSGFDVLARLKEDPTTMDIPVVVLTSKTLTDEERRRLAPHARRILSKQALAAGGEVDHLRDVLSGMEPREAGRG